MEYQQYEQYKTCMCEGGKHCPIDEGYRMQMEQQQSKPWMDRAYHDAEKLKRHVKEATQVYATGLRILPPWITMPMSCFGYDSLGYMPEDYSRMTPGECAQYKMARDNWLNAKAFLTRFGFIPS